jgi:hypothetical protein
MKRIMHLTGALALAVAASGCSSSSSPVSSTPPPTLLTNEYTGTLSPNGAASYPFAVAAAGQVTATLALLTPDTAELVGFGLGVWDGAACQTVPGVWNDKATSGTVVIGQANAAGSLCVRIFDAQGTLPQPETYDILITHP